MTWSHIVKSVIDDDLEKFKKYYQYYRGNIAGVIELTVTHNRRSFIKYLYNSNLEKDIYIKTACRLANYEIFTYLADLGGSLDDSTVYCAAVGGDIRIMRYLKDKGIIDKYKDTGQCKYSIVIAAIRDHIEVLSLLLDEEIEINEDIVESIEMNGYTMGKNHRDTLRILHNRGYKNEHACVRNACLYCDENKKSIVEESWCMETEIYDSYIQWLPKETLEDAVSLLV